MADASPGASPELLLSARNSTLFRVSGISLMILAGWGLAQGVIGLCFAARFFSWKNGGDLAPYVLVGLLMTVAVWVVALVASLRGGTTARKFTLDYSFKTTVTLIWTVFLIIWEAACYAALQAKHDDSFVVAAVGGIAAASWLLVMIYFSNTVAALLSPTVSASAHEYYITNMNAFEEKHHQ